MKVNAIYPAIQGEGTMQGVPMILVRLQGCSIGCPWCDTQDAQDPDSGKEMSVAEILAEVITRTQGQSWVLLTGGEPLEQDTSLLVIELQSVGYGVALETSGTRPVPYGFDWVCVSPKNGALSEIQRADEVKVIVGKHSDLPIGLDHENIVVQPLSLDEKATAICIKAAERYGWRLSLQLHKYANLP